MDVFDSRTDPRRRSRRESTAVRRWTTPCG